MIIIKYKQQNDNEWRYSNSILQSRKELGTKIKIETS